MITQQNNRSKPEIPDAQTYAYQQGKTGIKVGDLVLVTRTSRAYEAGWQASWQYNMNQAVGLLGRVTAASPYLGFKLEFPTSAAASGYYYPHFVVTRVAHGLVNLQELKDAHKAGKTIQHRCNPLMEWRDIEGPLYFGCKAATAEYRIKPEDPYAAFRQAQKAGKTIQVELDYDGSGLWEDIPAPAYDREPGACRVKPEPHYRAWAANEVPLGSQVRQKVDSLKRRYLITKVLADPSGGVFVRLGGVVKSVQVLLRACECAPAGVNAPENAWKACGVLVEE